MRRERTVWRVFLMPGTLQVDIAFWPADDFGVTGPSFQLLFGPANDPGVIEPPPAATQVGWAWLYALHVRSSIARGRVFHAEHMLAGMRERVVALACVRHGLIDYQGRGVDDLPDDVKDALAATIVRSLDTPELTRAFAAVTEALLAEATHVDVEHAALLQPALRELVATARP